jgi:Cu-Zn family superoxide dismutase
VPSDPPNGWGQKPDKPTFESLLQGEWFMTSMKRLTAIALVLLLPTFLLTAAEPSQKEKAADEKAGAVDIPKKAVCVMTPTKGSQVSGVVTFTQKGDEIEITGEIVGLTPGKHGFHVHEFGDLNSPDGMATGGHFNPDKEKHGGPHDKMRHVGDLGNVEADASGKVTLKMTDKLIQLHGPHSIIGRGLIVHAKADDLKSQPAGDAGGRMAQGVIGVAK